MGKATNGEDADTPPGPTLPVGSTAHFTYVVRNTGNIPLTDVTVTDDKGVIVTCPSGNPIPLLRRGHSETCTGSATVSPGQYANRGSVSYTHLDVYKRQRSACVCWPPEPPDSPFSTGSIST